MYNQKQLGRGGSLFLQWRKRQKGYHEYDCDGDNMNNQTSKNSDFDFDVDFNSNRDERDDNEHDKDDTFSPSLFEQDSESSSSNGNQSQNNDFAAASHTLKPETLESILAHEQRQSEIKGSMAAVWSQQVQHAMQDQTNETEEEDQDDDDDDEQDNVSHYSASLFDGSVYEMNHVGNKKTGHATKHAKSRNETPLFQFWDQSSSTFDVHILWEKMTQCGMASHNACLVVQTQ